MQLAFQIVALTSSELVELQEVITSVFSEMENDDDDEASDTEDTIQPLLYLVEVFKGKYTDTGVRMSVCVLVRQRKDKARRKFFSCFI